jgi:hypothetical protein
MTTTSLYVLLFVIIFILTTNTLAMQFGRVYAIQLAAVPFDNIPIAKIITDKGEYKLDPDFSIDYGDETVIEKNLQAKSVENMKLDKKINGSSLELECDSNDNCGTNLAPMLTKIYLVGDSETEDVIANNNITALDIISNDCGNLTTQDCANFSFTVPDDIAPQSYKLVVQISFDEAKWLFINSVQISN